MRVKSFTYRKTWTGTYRRQRFLPTWQTMDKHIETMLSDGWEIMSQNAHSARHRGMLPFAKRDTITISFKKA